MLFQNRWKSPAVFFFHFAFLPENRVTAILRIILYMSPKNQITHIKHRFYAGDMMKKCGGHRGGHALRN
jgi:hypothetical protein